MENVKSFHEFRLYEIGDGSVDSGMHLMTQNRHDHKGWGFSTKGKTWYYTYFEKKEEHWLKAYGLYDIVGNKKAWETSYGVQNKIGDKPDFTATTNKGEQYEIMSTVIEITGEFLKHFKGEADVIIAKPTKDGKNDTRRLKFYKTYLDKTKLFKKVEIITPSGDNPWRSTDEIILMWVK
jgi:hypothetical protein